MAKDYAMKDLGYERTPTDAKYRVRMPDGSWWEVPVQIIADDRDTHYASEEEDTVGGIRRRSLTEYEINDWASNNMNWSDVEEYSMKLDVPQSEVDYEDGWCNGEKEINGAI